MELSVKGLIFDYGGTIDTNGIHWGEMIWQAYSDVGAIVSRENFRDAYVYVERLLGSQTIIHPDHTFRNVLEIKIELQFGKLGLTDMSKAKKIIEKCYENATQTIRRASETLDELVAHYPAILVSNFYGNLRTVMNEFGLTKCFGEIIESAEVDIRKPDPEIYKMAINKFGFEPEEIVIIGDSYKNDINPANILGCPSIWLKGKGWDDKDDAIEHPFVIKDFSELKSLLFN